MATLYVTELANIGYDSHGHFVLAPFVPPIVEQAIAIGSGSVASTAFQNGTRYLLVNTDAACCLGFGPTAVATNGFHRMAANETRFYSVKAGDQIAVIVSS